MLWYDGTVEVSAESVPELLLQGICPSKIVVREQNEDIELFNSINECVIQSSKDKNNYLDRSWNIPPKYNVINIEEYFLKIINDRLLDYEYENRLNLELKEIKNRNLVDLFKCLIYVVNELKNNSIVWGVGRGSSCASLCLFLLGLHLIDPVKYDIPLSEFFHD